MFHFEASQLRTAEWGQYSCFVFGRPGLKFRSADKLILNDVSRGFSQSPPENSSLPKIKQEGEGNAVSFLISLQETATSETRKWCCLCACAVVGIHDPSPGSTGHRMNHVISRRHATSAPKSCTPAPNSSFATANSGLIFAYFRCETTGEEYNQHYRLLYSYTSFFFTDDVWVAISQLIV